MRKEMNKAILSFEFCLLNIVLMCQTNPGSIQTNRTLLLNSGLVNSINIQAKQDSANHVTIVADTIQVIENIYFLNLDVTLLCNYIETGSNNFFVYPDTSSNVIEGAHGKNITLWCNSFGKCNFHLPGADGGKGENGENGENGNELFALTNDPKKNGTKGENGKQGGNGGNGGNIILQTINNGMSINLIAPGGKGGLGGDGGTGGISYYGKATKKIGKQPQEMVLIPESRIEANGLSGAKGKDGKKGEIEKKEITQQDFFKKVSLITFHEWEDIQSWQIILDRVEKFSKPTIQGFIPLGGGIKKSKN